MAGKMSKRGRYQKCVDALIEARKTGNPQKVKESLTYMIGVAKQFPTVDGLTSLLDFWFSPEGIDNQPWIVEILREPYVEAGKFSVRDLDDLDKESSIEISSDKLKIQKSNLKLKDNGLNGNMRLVQD